MSTPIHLHKKHDPCYPRGIARYKPGAEAMSNSIINQDQKPRNYRITSTSNHVIRLYPELWKQIGLEESIALLQIDYWIATEGLERKEFPGRWVKMSAATMQARAFGNWSVRKTQRIIHRLVHDEYLFSFAFDAPADATPYYSLNDAKISSLEGITLLTENIRHSFHYVTPTPEDSPPPATPQPPTPTESPHPTGTLLDVFNQTIDKFDVGYDKFIAPHVSSDVGTPYIYKDLVEDSDLEDSGVSRAPRVTSPPPPDLHILDEEPSENQNWMDFCRDIARVCMMDFDANQGRILRTAKKLWKGGNGYTRSDLITFAQWWPLHDWRGQKGEFPTPELIAELILQALEWSSTQAENRRNRYISNNIVQY